MDKSNTNYQDQKNNQDKNKKNKNNPTKSGESGHNYLTDSDAQGGRNNQK